MRSKLARFALCSILAVGLSGIRLEARSDDRNAVSDAAAADSAALRELLEGKKGRRESWQSTPSLVVITSVMNYEAGDLASGYAATDESLTDKERDALVADLTRALAELTGGQMKAFSSVKSESAVAGETVKVLRAGQIVVGRFRGVQSKMGSIGYGGRMTNREGRISSAVVMVDRDADRDSKHQPVVRTHELGHALGYNHVESRPSIMNPRADGGLTEFDRMAARVAFSPVQTN